MSPSRPYLIRALYEWICDNGFTPYITVDMNSPQVSLPKNYATDDWMTLDLSSTAVQQLLISNQAITGMVRFGGTAHDLYLPIRAVVAIYAKETQHGMNFPHEEYAAIAIEEEAPTQAEKIPFKPKLQILEGGKKDS